MKVLVVSSRNPWPPHTGDRLRAQIWLEALREHELTLVAPGGSGERRATSDEGPGARDRGPGTRVRGGGPPVPRNEAPLETGSPAPGSPAPDPRPPAPEIRHIPLRRSPAALLGAALRVLREGLPFHSLIAAGYDWHRALRRAHEEHGPFDAAVILLSRCEPWARSELRAQRKILDAIDALSLSMEERARSGNPLIRWFWRMEARRTGRLESRLIAAYDRVTVVGEKDRRRLGEGALLIPNGVEIDSAGLSTTERRFDFGFWGNLPYFANADALRWLLEEIWPRIRDSRPEATLLIAGAKAPRWLRHRSGRDGVTVVSPMHDRRSLLRDVKIALLPLRVGSGQSNKILEAGEAGCAIAATPTAFRGLADVAGGQIVEQEASVLAARAVALLADAARIRGLGVAARERVEQHHGRAAVLQLLREIVQG